MTTLYVIGTPIGNLEDLSLRALRILSEVDVILCEDTRTTKKLLARYEIKAQTESYHAQSSLAKMRKIIGMLEDGKSLALVSDAGTPTISDPGVKLIAGVREELGDEVEIVTVPGPSALTAALSISGVPASDFLFLGFLPHKKGREKLFSEIAETKRTVVFYESPHRILKTLNSLGEHLSEGRKVVIGRELTKVYEEILRGTPAELTEQFEQNSEKVRGEFVVVIEPRR